MSKRNFILLIIILIIITAVVLGYLYFYQKKMASDGIEVTNFLDNFNPFGSSNKPQPPKDETPVYDNNTGRDETPESALKLKKVSSMPVAGYGIFAKERFKEVGQAVPPAATSSETPPKTVATPPETEFVPAVRYVVRSNGNIFQTFADKIDERKFSSTVVPKVYEAYFGNKGESVIMRYLKIDDSTIETFIGKIPKETLGADSSTENEIKGIFLPPNVKDISLSPDNSKLFYLLDIGESVVGTIYGLADDKKVQIFDSSFTEWNSWWGSDKNITLTTKPSAFIPGYMYIVNSETKKLDRVLGGINGLTTLLSPDGKRVLYSGSDLSLNLYDIENKASTGAGLKTLPEKCTWNKTGSLIYCAVPKTLTSISYPDVWYMGEVTFSDQIWKIDTETGTTELILDPMKIGGGEEADAVKLGIDENEEYLFYLNKKDSYLWELKLK